MEPLKKDPKTAKYVDDIFGNIEQILQMNLALLMNLEGRAKEKKDSIGDCFLEMVLFNSILTLKGAIFETVLHNVHTKVHSIAECADRM